MTLVIFDATKMLQESCYFIFLRLTMAFPSSSIPGSLYNSKAIPGSTRPSHFIVRYNGFVVR